MERFQMILDASVVTKWFLMEEYTDKALKIREKYANGELNMNKRNAPLE
jgi:predicted nucleic acid-binding protein